MANHMILMVAGTSALALFLSSRPGRVLDKYPVGRASVAVVAVACVVVARTWGEWAELQSWLVWFVLGAAPLGAHVVWATVNDGEQREFDRHSVQKNNRRD